MKRHDPAIYPGTYVTCVYRHDKALCRRGSEIADPTPELADCNPLTRRNIALTTDNISARNKEVGRVDRQLTR